jgi:hypothetical protein
VWDEDEEDEDEVYEEDEDEVYEEDEDDESKNILGVKSKKGPPKEPIIFKTTKEAFEYFAKLNKSNKDE